MRNVARLPDSDRGELFRNTADKMGLNDAIVEKDFWVCFTLDHLFHRCPWKDAITFKGGTSLSKAFNLISRFYDIQTGHILIDDYDVQKISIESLRQQMGVMTQDNFLFSGTIKDNIRYGKLDATDEEIIAAAKAVNAHDFILKLEKGYDTVLSERGGGLSIGQKQLLAFARTMVSDPRILILDEATAFADPDNEAKVQAAFAQLAKGKTVLMIAHRLSTVANADCIYVVQDGQIVESGTKDELCAQNGLFARMWQDYQTSVQWKVAKEG